MNTKPKILKASARFMRDADKMAIERVNQAAPIAGQEVRVGPTLSARITAIRRNIGLAAEKPEVEAATPAI